MITIVPGVSKTYNPNRPIGLSIRRNASPRLLFTGLTGNRGIWLTSNGGRGVWVKIFKILSAWKFKLARPAVTVHFSRLDPRGEYESGRGATRSLPIVPPSSLLRSLYRASRITSIQRASIVVPAREISRHEFSKMAR